MECSNLETKGLVTGESRPAKRAREEWRQAGREVGGGRSSLGNYSETSMTAELVNRKRDSRKTSPAGIFGCPEVQEGGTGTRGTGLC